MLQRILTLAPQMKAVAVATPLLLTAAVGAQVTVTKEVDRGADREITGTFVFDTVPSNSSTDLAHGRAFTVLAGSPHRASGKIAVLTDGPAQKNWDSVPESFFATDDTTHIRIQIKLSTIHDIGEINTYSWHRNSRAPQDYRVYVALAPSNNAPDFKAAAFQDDVALGKLGYKPVASVSTHPQSGGQTGVSVAGNIGFQQYVLFDMRPNYIANVQRSTFYGEIDIVPSGVARFGRSSRGCKGELDVAANSVPRIGNSTFAVTCSNAPPRTTGAFALAPRALGRPVVVLGVEIWLDLNAGWFLVLPAGSDANGAAKSTLPLPDNPTLVKQQINAQFFWVGPTSPPPCPPLGVSASRGLAITIQG